MVEDAVLSELFTVEFTLMRPRLDCCFLLASNRKNSAAGLSTSGRDFAICEFIV